MRLLFARVGIPYSPATGLPIESQTVSQMVDRVLALPEGTRLYLLAPIVRGRKGEYKQGTRRAAEEGLPARQDRRQFYEIADAPALDKKLKHDIDVVVDRIVVRPTSARACRQLRDGAEARRRHRRRRIRRQAAAEEETARNPTSRSKNDADLFSEKFACPVSGFTIPEIEPRLFSFNNPFGACPTCDGLGTEQKIDPT
jgi:excinuclease ABC subunit A